ncbi:hypothetical protein [Kitasatospora sp. NPDC001683]
MLPAAFPAEFAADAADVMAVVPAARHRPLGPFAVVVEGEQIAIPHRVHHDEPSPAAVAGLSPRQRQLLHCWYSRHGDGWVRQRHLARIVRSADPWVVPFVLRLVGEYVLEILVAIGDELPGLLAPGSPGRLAYGRFIAANPAFFDRLQRQVVSYWSCYHRELYPDFRAYPGCTALDLLRSAAADSAGHPWPSLAPKSPAAVHGYR